MENIKVYDEVTFRRYPPYKQKLWPDHCVQGSQGAKFHTDLTTPKRSQIIQKGTNPLIDSYSAFYDNTDIKGSGDTGLKRLVKDSTEVVVVGLAQDYCVAATTLDSLDARQVDGARLQLRHRASQALGAQLHHTCGAEHKVYTL